MIDEQNDTQEFKYLFEEFLKKDGSLLVLEGLIGKFTNALREGKIEYAKVILRNCIKFYPDMLPEHTYLFFTRFAEVVREVSKKKPLPMEELLTIIELFRKLDPNLVQRYFPQAELLSDSDAEQIENFIIERILKKY